LRCGEERSRGTWTARRARRRPRRAPPRPRQRQGDGGSSAAAPSETPVGSAGSPAGAPGPRGVDRRSAPRTVRTEYGDGIAQVDRLGAARHALSQVVVNGGSSTVRRAVPWRGLRNGALHLAERSVVSLEPARPHELAVLVAESYGLAPERAVARLVGAKSVDKCDRWATAPVRLDRAGPPQTTFEKVGVGTWGELIARLFFENHVPSLTRETICS